MIQVILEWILTNWKLVFAAILLLFYFILVLVSLFQKKVKVLDTVRQSILSMLPELICKVEEPGNGKAKLKAVVEMCVAAITKLYPGVNASQYIGFIMQSVEAILKTPQKKG